MPLSDQAFSAFLGEAESEEDRRRGRRRLVAEARRWWEAREAFREERREARDFYRSRQWGRQITAPGGERMTEREYIERQGRMPMVMNLVANVINSVEGQFRQNKSDRQAFAVEREDEEAVRMMNLARRATRRYNDSDILEADQFKEHVLSGASGFKQSFEWDARLNRREVTDYALDQGRLFYNLDLADRRFEGLRLIGELHDVTQQELIARFARSKREAARLKEIYGDRGANDGTGYGQAGDYGFDQWAAGDFGAAPEPGLCRVIEVWTPVYAWVRTGLDPLFGTPMEVIPEGYGEVVLEDNDIARIQNERRAEGLPLLELDAPRYEPHWHYYFLSPDGELLDEGATPFRHGEHPYAPSMAMLLDGETWGLVTSIKDPQRWLNRLLAHIDHAMGAGAKGAVAYDEDFMRDNGLTQKDVDEWYTSADGALGVSVPRGKKLGDFVETFVSERLPAGFVELIPTLTGFIEKISGVTGAMQGREPASGTPAALYQQQVAQASANILGYLESYFEGLRRKDRKELQLLQQAITEPRTYAAQSVAGEPVEVDPARIADIDLDVAIGSVSDTATYRMLWEDSLMQLMQQGVIPPEVYLQESSHPKAQSLLMRLQEHQQSQLMQQAQVQTAMMQADAAIPDEANASEASSTQRNQ